MQKEKTKPRNTRDKNYDNIKISDLPKNILNSVREITFTSCEDSLSLINSAISSRETTNNIDDVGQWCENHLAKKTIVVTETEEEFYNVVYAAILSLPEQCQIGIAKKERGPIEMLNDKVNGYMVEFAVKKLAKTIDVDIILAHEKGSVEQFIHSDFPRVFECGQMRNARINIGAKSGKKNSLWMDVPMSQFRQTDYQIFGRVCSNGHNLQNESLCSLMNNPYLRDRKFPEYVLKYMRGLKLKPVSVYIAGFAPKPKCSIFKYKGYKAKTIFHITEINSIVPTDYESVVREKEKLPDDCKIKIEKINKFNKQTGPFFACNSGSILKNVEDILEIIRKL